MHEDALFLVEIWGLALHHLPSELPLAQSQPLSPPSPSSTATYLLHPPLSLQTWPFMVAGKPESDLKEVVTASRLCGTTAS